MKLLSIELSLLLLVSVVAFAGFISFQSSDAEALTGYALFGSSKSSSAPKGYSCGQYGGVCAQSSSSNGWSWSPYKKPATCQTGYYNFGSTYDCNVCCKKIEYSLRDFPKLFIINGAFSKNFVVIFGSSSRGQYVAAASSLLNYLSAGKIPIPISTSKLDTEIKDISQYNSIIVGTDNDNKWIKTAGDLLFEPYEAVARFVRFSNGNYAIFITGDKYVIQQFARDFLTKFSTLQSGQTEFRVKYKNPLQILYEVYFSNAHYYPSDKPAGDYFTVEMTNTGKTVLDLKKYALALDGNGQGAYNLDSFPAGDVSPTDLFLKSGEKGKITVRATPTAPLFAPKHCTEGFGIGIIAPTGVVAAFSTLPRMKLSCEPWPCIDTDNGLNYSVKGTACQGDKCFTDSCDSSTYLLEHDCGWENGIFGSTHNGLGGIGYTCPNGCKEGACVA